MPEQERCIAVTQVKAKEKEQVVPFFPDTKMTVLFVFVTGTLYIA